VHTENLEYDADGQRMIGHLVRTSSERRPGVLVFPDAGGLGGHAKGRAERIAAELGYVAMACDLWGQQEVIREFSSVMPRLRPLRASAQRVRSLTLSALAVFAGRPEVDPERVAAIGFCFGGTLTFELALTGANIRAAVGFHSGLTVTSPADAKHIRANLLALLGADDPSITAADRNTFEGMLREARVNWQMTLYGGVVHSFTNPHAANLGRPEFARYDSQADKRSWQQMSALFKEVLG